MGLSVDAVKGRVFQGRRKLHQVLKRESAWMSEKQILRASRKANVISRHQLACSSCDWRGEKGGSRVPTLPRDGLDPKCPHSTKGVKKRATFLD
jgi:hypothetical protein